MSLISWLTVRTPTVFEVAFIIKPLQLSSFKLGNLSLLSHREREREREREVRRLSAADQSLSGCLWPPRVVAVAERSD